MRRYRMLAFLPCLLLAECCLTNCAPQATELERQFTVLTQDVIRPAVEKALAETSTRTATLQGGGQLINPGYEITVDGFFGTGVHAKTLVTVVGVSGQLVGHAQGDAGQAGAVPPPVMRDTTPEPEVEP